MKNDLERALEFTDNRELDSYLDAAPTAAIRQDIEQMMSKASKPPSVDELCTSMLRLGMFSEGTQDLKASEIRDLLIPFFGQERVAKSVDFLCNFRDRQ